MKHETCENLAYFPSFFASHAKSSTISKVVVVFVIFEISDDFQVFFVMCVFPRENQPPILGSHRVQETKRKRREFIEKHAKKFKVDESAEEEQNDEQMDDIGSRGLKRKAEDNQETDPMEVMDCMCESPIDVMNIVEEDDMLEECKADDCMEETTRNWAEETEEEQTFYDYLTGKALKHKKVIEARLDEIKAMQDMGVWEVVPAVVCCQQTKSQISAQAHVHRHIQGLSTRRCLE